MFEIFTNYFDFCLKFSCFNLFFSNKNIKEGENRVLFIFSTICVNYRPFLSSLFQPTRPHGIRLMLMHALSLRCRWR